MTRATVLIPTHDHGHLLRHATETVLVQSVSDIEVFVVLDGADDTTRAVAQELALGDDRVRIFEFPKGERHGEAHRHLVLGEATGRIVCYHSDDDLWFSDHIEYMEGLLEHADFANTLAVTIRPNGEIENPVGDLGLPYYRQRLLDHISINFVGLLNAGHTLDMYRTRGHAWEPAPPGVPTDLFMWRRFFSDPSVRLKSGGRPTALHFASTHRQGMPLEARLEELARWHRKLLDPQWQAGFRLEFFEFLSRKRAERAAELEPERDRLEHALEVSARDWKASQDALAAMALENTKLDAALAASAEHWRQAQETIAGVHRKLEDGR